MGAVEFERQCVEVFERAVMVALGPRPAQAGLDLLAVAFGEMVEHVAFLVLHAALNGHLVAEHLPDGFPERLRSVNDEQHPLLDIEPTVHQIGQQRARHGRVFSRAVPQAERELVALGGDPERDDHHPALQFQPVEHHHSQPQI